MVEVTYKKLLIPNRIIYLNEVKSIKKINVKYYITAYKLKIDLDLKLVSEIYINSIHPNAEDGIFCLPYPISINDNTPKANQAMIENLLKTFNLDNCYFRPWLDMEINENKKEE